MSVINTIFALCFNDIYVNLQRNYKSTFVIVASLFFLWGFVTVLVTLLVPRLRDVFGLSYFEAGFIQLAFFAAYFILSIPSSYLLSRVGYKCGILSGLLVMALGCVLLYPAAAYRLLYLFWIAVFVLAGGITLLQVVANPYITLLGSDSGASSRLNFAHAFNSLGTSLAPLVGAVFILSGRVLTQGEIGIMLPEDRALYFSAEATAIQFPFMVMAAISIGMSFIFSVIRLPDVIIRYKPSWSDYRHLLRNKNTVYGAVAIFLYVGVEVAIGSYLINYFIKINTVRSILESPFMLSVVDAAVGLFAMDDIRLTDPKAIVGIFVSFYWGGAMAGRFVGALLTRILRPTGVLSVFALAAIALILLSINSDGLTAMWSILAVGFFNSIMFPTVFSLSMLGIDKRLRSQVSGILCTAIVGGAIIPPVFGYFADYVGFGIAFLTLIACYVYIFFYVFLRTKSPAEEN
ncbi:MAG: sugar MFS transporter [Capnocytophaga sp.]|nr:sugar MFS transporter [Capnocytophaga sp.]